MFLISSSLIHSIFECVTTYRQLFILSLIASSSYSCDYYCCPLSRPAELTLGCFYGCYCFKQRPSGLALSSHFSARAEPGIQLAYFTLSQGSPTSPEYLPAVLGFFQPVFSCLWRCYSQLRSCSFGFPSLSLFDFSINYTLFANTK